MSTQTDHEAFFATLEETGEATVRANLAKKVYGTKSNLTQEWLRSKESDREESRLARAEERSEKALEISSEQLRQARLARNAAWTAAIAAIIATVAAISDVFIFSSSFTEIKGETSKVFTNESPNNCIQPTHFHGVSFVANATSLTPLQWAADAWR